MKTSKMNVAYLESESDADSDECYTPRFVIEPLVKHLHEKGFKNIWCPFDKQHSMFVRVLTNNGFNVNFTHIETGDDFFFFDSNYARQHDCIVSNPPFSMKDDILQRCYDLNLPFALLLPQNSLQGIDRVEMFTKYGMEYMGFNRRIPYYTRENMDVLPTGNHFSSGFFCHEVLNEKLIFEKVKLIQEKYHDYTIF